MLDRSPNGDPPDTGEGDQNKGEENPPGAESEAKNEDNEEYDVEEGQKDDTLEISGRRETEDDRNVANARNNLYTLYVSDHGKFGAKIMDNLVFKYAEWQKK